MSEDRRRTMRYRLLAAVLVAVALLSLATPLDEYSRERTTAALVRASAIYGTVRVLNATISVLQGSHFDMKFLGTGASVALGEALDPANDFVESFGSVMLLGVVALTAQRLLLAVTGTVGVRVVAAAAAALLALLLWRAGTRGRLPGLSARLLLAVVLVRFAVPLAVLASDGTTWAFFARSEPPAREEVQALGRQLDLGSVFGSADADADEPPLEGGTLALLGRVRSALTQLDAFIDAAVVVIARTLLETLVFPLGFLLAAWALGRRLLHALGASPARPAAEPPPERAGPEPAGGPPAP